jgi:hypothetical protein
MKERYGLPQGHPEPWDEAAMDRHANGEFGIGFLVGLLVGDGCFGGDRVQASVTVGMHPDHAEVFKWLGRVFPGGRLYGPYTRGQRRLYRWLVRGRVLQNQLIPLLDQYLKPEHSEYAYERYWAMKGRYRLSARPVESGPSDGGQEPRPRSLVKECSPIYEWRGGVLPVYELEPKGLQFGVRIELDGKAAPILEAGEDDLGA